MATLNRSDKKKVTLVGFAPKVDSFRRPKAGGVGGEGDSITITVNGVSVSPSSRRKESSPEKVKLVGFSRQESVGADGKPQKRTPTVNGSTQKSSTERQERRERITRLTEETREWFEKMNRQQGKPETAPGAPPPRPGNLANEDPFREGSDTMRRFFDNARQKFNQCSEELFEKFVQDNQERFSQMLDNAKSMRGNKPFAGTSTGDLPSAPQKKWFQEKSESFTSEQTTTTSSRDSGVPGSPPSRPPSSTNGFFHASSPSDTDSGSSSFKTASSFAPFDTFRSTTTIPGEKNEEGFPRFTTTPECPLGSSRQFMSFPAFPTFPLFHSPTPSPGHSPKPGRGAFQMSSSKSTFEYCGNTNTYKFSTEQMSQSYDQSFDAVSESDDDDEEETLSISGDASECDEVSVESAESPDGRILALQYDTKLEKLNNTLNKIATELLTTERTYVGILHLIDQVFQFRVDNENRAHHMFPQEMITQMFSNIKSIYKLHHDFLLPQLEQRMSNWSQDPRIGDIMKNFAPFLKMYTEYVRNFDNAMNTINFWYAKHARFHKIVEEIHHMPECGHLTLQHHMLGPVQRVPRYELLLKDYLKKLPETSPDRADTEKALHLVSTAANHSNEAMKKIDKFKKLLEIQDLIGGSIDLVSPTRELVREGKIIKISARSGDHQERYLFLFNDLLLLCSQRLISNRVVSGPSYRVRAKLDVDNLQILEGDNLETANTFYVRNNQKTIELYTQTPEEKSGWMNALYKAVQDLYKRKSSLKIGAEPVLVQDSDLGQRAPTFLKMESMSSCMNCDVPFTAFRRRHHCRACGKIVCHKCSSHKFALAYDENRPNRVCNHCFAVLAADDRGNRDQVDGTANLESPIERKGVLEVKAMDESVVNGFLHLKTRGKTWVRRWFALHRDFVLYSFKGNEDSQAMTSTPVPGFGVAVADKSDGVNTEREHVFKLFHKKKTYLFQASDKTEMNRWVKALEKASRAEVCC